MPDQDSEFLIKIKTLFDGAGITATSEQLNLVAAKLPGISDAAKKSADALEESGKRGKEGSEKGEEATRKFELSHRELRESVHATARALGGLGEVGLLLSGPTAVVFMLTKGIEALRDRWAEQTAAAIEAAHAMQQFDASKIKAAADAARDMAEEMENYEQAQRNATSGEAAFAEAAQTASNQRLAEFDAQIEAVKKLNDAEEKLAEAEIDRMAEAGTISKEEADRRKHVLQERLADSNAAGDAAKERERIAEKENELAAAKARLPQEQREQREAGSSTKPINQERKRFEDAAEEADKKAKDARDALTKRQGEVHSEAAGEGFAGLKDTYAATVLGMLPGLDSKKIFAGIQQENNKQLETQTKYTEMLEARAEHLKALIAEDKKSADAAKKRAEELEKQIEADKKTVANAPDEIASAKRIVQIHEDNQRQVQRAQTATHQVQESTAGITERQRIMEGHGTAAEIREMGTPQDMAEQDEWARRGRGSIPNLQQAQQALHRLQAANATHSASGGEVEALLNEFIGLSHNANTTNRSAFAQFANEVVSIRNQMAQYEQQMGDIMTRLRTSP